MPAPMEERVTSVADEMMHIDLSKLEGAWGKGGAGSPKNMLELVRNQLAF